MTTTNATLMGDALMRTVEVDGSHVEYLELGTGPALVLVHGDGETARDWQWVAPGLADAGYRVIAPSLPGHGASAPSPSYAMADLASWVGRFADAVGVSGATFGGNSIGGSISVHLALQAPDRVHRLVLIDSAGFGHAVNPVVAAETMPLAGEIAIAMALSPGGPLLRALVRANDLFGQPWLVPPGWWADQLRWSVAPPILQASVACKRAIMDVFGQYEVLLDRLPQIDVPTLVLWGALDKVVPLSHGEAAARLLPNARLEVLAACGHIPHVECPQGFLAPVVDFLDQTRSAA